MGAILLAWGALTAAVTPAAATPAAPAARDAPAGVVTPAGMDAPAAPGRAAAPRRSGTQVSPPPGLDRIDQRVGLDQRFGYAASGEGVTVYVLDTGLRAEHTEFGGRVRPGPDLVLDAVADRDVAGHGTHVASVIAGATVGVAKDATIVPARVSVLGPPGVPTLVEALNWVRDDHAATGGPAVVNLSLGVAQGAQGAADVDTAVRGLVAAGITVVAAAGNDLQDACTVAPARVPEVIAVAASNPVDDIVWEQTGRGSCVDLVAPGVDIVGANGRADEAGYDAPANAVDDVRTGTSMATAHVSGAVAQLLEVEPDLRPAEVARRLTGRASYGVLQNLPEGTPDALLYTGPDLIMATGDSITQGLEGDVGWRARLDQHLRRRGAWVNFVGPWRGTTALPASLPADYPATVPPPFHDGAHHASVAGFDSEHFAQWGWQMHLAKDRIRTQVAIHRPHRLIVELGFNDLAWGISDELGLLDDLHAFITEARRANPRIEIVVANVVSRTPIEAIPDLNDRIANYAAGLAPNLAAWATPESPIRLADIHGAYVPTTDSYDGLHPGMRGDYVLAREFAEALEWGGLGGPFLPESQWEVPARVQPGPPSRIDIAPTPAGYRVSWPHVFAAGGHWIESRDRTERQTEYQRAWFPVGADSWELTRLPAGHSIDYRIVTMRGDWEAAPVEFHIDVPALPMVEEVTVRPAGLSSLEVSWTPVPGADDYAVYATRGCPDGPPVASDFQMVQWGLGSRTSWRQDYITTRCVYYTVVGIRNGGQGPRHPPVRGERLDTSQYVLENSVTWEWWGCMGWAHIGLTAGNRLEARTAVACEPYDERIDVRATLTVGDDRWREVEDFCEDCTSMIGEVSGSLLLSGTTWCNEGQGTIRPQPGIGWERGASACITVP